MASVSKNIEVQEPLLSRFETRLANLSENSDGLIPFEFNSNREACAFGYQFSVTSSNTPSMTSSIQSIYPTAVGPCSSTSDALPFSPPKNVLEDNSSSRFAHSQTQEIGPSTEAIESAKLPADSYSEQPGCSISLQEAYPLVGAGLANLGNTCFMNSILQCMTHTTLLVQGLRIADHLQSCQGGNNYFCLFSALHEHIELSLSSSGGVVLPHKLVDNLSYISSYFERLQQEDAHEFLQSLLDKLGGPCLYLMENKRSLVRESDNLVKNIFGGGLVSKLCCCSCGHLSDKIEPLMDLSLEIENVDSLVGALESFTNVEKIDDPDMQFTCENCREVVSIEKQFMLNEVPSVATFHLKRFKSDGISVEKIKKPVTFPVELDLKPYTWSACDTDVEHCYELYAVVEHVGEASTSGHYISFVRPSPNSWFRFDDSKVTWVPENFVLSQEAYILFYAKKGTPWARTLMEGNKPSFDNNALIALPAAVPDDSCHQQPMIDNCNVGESTELGGVVPSLISSHPLSNEPSVAVGEFDCNLGPDALKSCSEGKEEHGKENDNENMNGFHTLTPAGSPEPNTAVVKSKGQCVPRARPKPEKLVNAERSRKKAVDNSEKREGEGPLKNAMENNSEKREALRYVQKRMPSARGMRFVAAMLESRGEGPSVKARKRTRTSPCKKSRSPNTRQKLPHNSSVARFVAARN